MSEYKKFDFKKLYFILYIVLVLLVVLLLFKLGIFLFPFVIAVFFSIIIQPFGNFLRRKLKFSKKIATITSIVIFLIFFLSFISIVSLRLFGEIYKLSKNINTYTEDFKKLWTAAIDQGYIYLGYLPKGFTNQIKNSVTGVISLGSSKIGSFINGLIYFVTSIPTIIIYICITVLSTFFISLDKKEILKFLEQQLPELWLKKIYNIKKEMFTVLGSYIKAQIILMTICFFELLISFNLLFFLKFNIPYPLLISIVICLIDALPILGAGAILLPWAGISFLLGDIKLGLALILIYLLVLSVRQIMEPKLISQNIGVHPLVTLISMYSGFKFFGIMGFLIGPVVMIILKNVFSRELEVGFFREIFGSDISENKNDRNSDKNFKNNSNKNSENPLIENMPESLKKFIDDEFIDDKKC
ncbi:sporulation integral membrane protein YtvI [Leptotrichia sp. OH3620_COT-345]|uniref:sporulation integral membrane protein YtvI n=1 Tax=Leptotrichia sp. OH3620_COT-345 TaxID=2491048 RepID=UPI000F653A40|nr:sporulation integral membrane protein YtvI [Leptotrichia sp. OH3620_COT-345]RRD40873.1 sporulation integral membrane protein YtvI [Leptotrichia sp. OH3620_COT-345]